MEAEALGGLGYRTADSLSLEQVNLSEQDRNLSKTIQEGESQAMEIKNGELERWLSN